MSAQTEYSPRRSSRCLSSCGIRYGSCDLHDHEPNHTVQCPCHGTVDTSNHQRVMHICAYHQSETLCQGSGFWLFRSVTVPSLPWAYGRTGTKLSTTVRKGKRKRSEPEWIHLWISQGNKEAELWQSKYGTKQQVWSEQSGWTLDFVAPVSENIGISRPDLLKLQ